jgi:hypothetical protein
VGRAPHPWRTAEARFEAAESTVSKYISRRIRPPSQSWQTFLRNHADAIAGIDLCLVPTLTFECLFVFLVVGHGRRQPLWFAVTRHPTAEWLAQQIVEAFPWEAGPGYLVRDNDGAYGPAFTRRVRAMGIRDRPISPRSPWLSGRIIFDGQDLARLNAEALRKLRARSIAVVFQVWLS